MSVNTWQLSLGRGDYEFILNFLQQVDLPNTMKYEKGDAIYKLLPKINDKVYVTCRAKLICKGYIYKDLEYNFNPNTNTYGMYYTIMITDIIYDQPYLKGQRRNWTLLTF